MSNEEGGEREQCKITARPPPLVSVFARVVVVGPARRRRHGTATHQQQLTTHHNTSHLHHSHSSHSSQVHMEHNDCGHGPSGMVACMMGGGWRSAETHLEDIDLSGGGWAVVTRLMGRVTTHTKLITTSAANQPSVSQSVFSQSLSCS